MKRYFPYYQISLTAEERLLKQYQGLMKSRFMLWEEYSSEISVFDLPRINILNAEDLVFEKNYRLGQRVEHFFKICLEHSNQYDIVQHNIQINDDIRTIGELDYIIFDKEKETYIHLELAYKFYCLDPSVAENEEACWIGPNRKDSFVKKKTKLLDKQFPLLKTSLCQDKLNQYELDVQSIQQQICFFAQRFIPYDFFKTKSYNQPFDGYWLRVNKLYELHMEGDVYFLPEKQDWLIQPTENNDWYSILDTISLIKLMLSEEKSPLLWIKRTNGNTEKCFVVWWPEI